jgi:hypothetical protein
VTDPLARCRWIERNDKGINHLCPLDATFIVQVDVPAADSVEEGELMLCIQHALQVPLTALARPR